jgi:hypothetical protein
MINKLKPRDNESIETFADTSYPKVMIPFRNGDPLIRKALGFDFKPEAKFSEIRDSNYHFKHSFNKWMAKKYRFRTSRLIVSEEYECVALDWDLGDGVHLATQTIDPNTHEVVNDSSVLYLVFLYKNKKEYINNANALTKLKEFLKRLEQMPNNPVKEVLLRATGIEGRNFSHLQQLEYIRSPKATSERLQKVYKRVLGIQDHRCLDQEGKPYQKVKFNPV